MSVTRVTHSHRKEALTCRDKELVCDTLARIAALCSIPLVTVGRLATLCRRCGRWLGRCGRCCRRLGTIARWWRVEGIDIIRCANTIGVLRPHSTAIALDRGIVLKELGDDQVVGAQDVLTSASVLTLALAYWAINRFLELSGLKPLT